MDSLEKRARQSNPRLLWLLMRENPNGKNISITREISYRGGLSTRCQVLFLTLPISWATQREVAKVEGPRALIARFD